MKSRFSTIDITAVVRELVRFVSMRVMNVYDVDNKTYLIRLGKPDDKAVILLESGTKVHSTEFEWPKNPAPSGFSMKLRKHLKGRRLESVQQLGVDRIVDLTFGSGEAAYHVILELYDRGNIVLTDSEYTILNILRPRTDTEDVRFAVRETYPVALAKEHEPPTQEKLHEIISSGKQGDTLKKLLIPHLDYGPAMIEHCLQIAGFCDNVKIGKGFNIDQDMQKLLVAIEEAESLLQLFQSQNSKGYIIQKSEKRPNAKAGEPMELLTYDEFHPFLFKQHEKKQYKEFDSFNKAVDEFFSQLESQKLELKTLQQEKAALKKLDNIKKDHEKRVEELQKEQEFDMIKGQLIEINLPLVDSAIKLVLTAVANQIDWSEIHALVKEAQMMGDPVAGCIKDLNLATNHITLLLKDPYVDSDFEDDEEDVIRPMKVDIDLALSAYANSRKYFEKKKSAAVKEQKTMDASSKALKSAERKTKETLKEVATAASINKARKTFWFEKFLWFISSENFLVVGGRDQQQNELLVKRYMKQGDIYVHADLHGASSVVIKNHTGESVPPKTLNEAGTMAICNSAAWDAKVVTSAWWVYPHQVSKTAPSGEYLTTGSFMIRGKKNFLPPSYLVYGFGFLFKLEDSSVFRHEGERRVRTADDDELSVVDSVTMETEVSIETDSEEDEDAEEEDVEQSGAEASSALKVTEGNADDENDNRDDDSDSDGADDKREVKKVTVKTTSNESAKTEQPDTVHVKMEEQSSSVLLNNEEGKTKCKLTVVKQKSSVPPRVQFPDTEINVKLVSGDKYELTRSHSTQDDDEEPVIHLGDNVPVVFGEKKAQTGSKLSAKQRREMRKTKKNQFGQQEGEEEVEDKVSWLADSNQGRKNKQTKEPKQQQQQKQDKHQQQQQQEQQQAQHKRGQKGKLKKIKEKYRDQDEEERQLRMEILNSAGSKKDDKKKKGKKEEERKPQSAAVKKKKPELVDIIIKDVDQMAVQDGKTEAVKEEEEEKPEEDTQNTTADVQLLNLLTGQPVSEDELLFAVPVCAPYNALTNYKYKVKLLPGSTKRGKAAKTALNIHLQDKAVTPRERDLLKILKDVDMSRNIPGKVKVTAPHLNRAKKK